jgi:hypothetical protein
VPQVNHRDPQLEAQDGHEGLLSQHAGRDQGIQQSRPARPAGVAGLGQLLLRDEAPFPEHLANPFLKGKRRSSYHY